MGVRLRGGFELRGGGENTIDLSSAAHSNEMKKGETLYGFVCKRGTDWKNLGRGNRGMRTKRTGLRVRKRQKNDAGKGG